MGNSNKYVQNSFDSQIAILAKKSFLVENMNKPDYQQNDVSYATFRNQKSKKHLSTAAREKALKVTGTDAN